MEDISFTDLKQFLNLFRCSGTHLVLIARIELVPFAKILQVNRVLGMVFRSPVDPERILNFRIHAAVRCQNPS
jgi:hypothetical protein